MAQAEASSNPVPIPIPAKLVLSPVDHGLAAMERTLLESGIPVHNVIEMLLNHAASVIAQIDPPGSREETVKGVVSSFSSMVRQHVDARHRTPGGVLKPGAGL